MVVSGRSTHCLESSNSSISVIAQGVLRLCSAIPRTLLIFTLLTCFIAIPQTARAEFDLNFSAQDPSSNFMMDYIANSDNNYPGQAWQNIDQGQTPWLWHSSQWGLAPEIVYDSSTKAYYYHMILGDFGSGFIQESYVQMGFGSYGNPAEPSNPTRKSASGGYGRYVPDVQDSNTVMLGNGYDPLDMNTTNTANNANIKAANSVSGNGSANPNRVILRQIVTDGEIMMEFLKDRYEYKPRISQMIMTPDFESQFDIDMREVKYNDITSASPVTNTMQLWGAGAPADAAAFDMSADSSKSTYNGGKYRYMEGAGPGGSEGTYEYVTGAFDQTAQSWKDYFDLNAQNPWAFEEAKLK
jgi:hypothetical protein